MNTAIITLVRNDGFFLNRWTDYYSRVRDTELFVLDHESDDGSTALLPPHVLKHVVTHPEMERAAWMLLTVQRFMQGLLDAGFRRVIYAEVDEYLVPDPARWDSLSSFLESYPDEFISAQGWSVVQQPGDAPLPTSGSLLMGRSWKRDERYDMLTGGSKVPHWKIGRHGLQDRPNGPDVGLRLVHAHYADSGLGWKRIHDRRGVKPIAQDGCGYQNKILDREDFDAHWAEMCSGGEPIPEAYWDKL